jgi:glycosyltransferase involved in cell wall biosynthesis
MLIGIDASRANREIKTGVEWYSYYLIEELKKITANTQDQFFLYTDKKLKGDLSKLPKNWKEKKLFWPFKYFWTKIRLSLEMLKNKPDVLFIPSHVLPLFFPKKTVITIHDLGYERYPEAYPKIFRFYLKKNYQLACRLAEKIIVPSNFTKKELITLYKVPAEKIEVVNLGYNEKIFRKIDEKEKIENFLKKIGIKKPYLLFVGRLEIKKGIKCLLQAYKFLLLNYQSLDISLVLAGKPGYGYNEIKNLKSKIKNLIEVGHLNQDDLPYLYNGAEIFIFPSLYEGFGMPVLEAMACGCPVIASDIEVLKEVGNDAVLFFKTDDFKDLVKKIKKILENQKLKEQMIQKGFKRVKNFSWQKCAQRTLEILLK